MLFFRASIISDSDMNLYSILNPASTLLFISFPIKLNFSIIGTNSINCFCKNPFSFFTNKSRNSFAFFTFFANSNLYSVIMFSFWHIIVFAYNSFCTNSSCFSSCYFICTSRSSFCMFIAPICYYNNEIRLNFSNKILFVLSNSSSASCCLRDSSSFSLSSSYSIFSFYCSIFYNIFSSIYFCISRYFSISSRTLFFYSYSFFAYKCFRSSYNFNF